MPSPSRSPSASSSLSGSDSDSPSYSYRSGDHSPIVSVEILRCMRCARTVEATSTDDVTTTGMIRIATGLYYCGSCANSVGFHP